MAEGELLIMGVTRRCDVFYRSNINDVQVSSTQVMSRRCPQYKAAACLTAVMAGGRAAVLLPVKRSVGSVH